MRKLANLVLVNVAAVVVFSLCVASFQKVGYGLDNDLDSKNASFIVQVEDYKTIEIY